MKKALIVGIDNYPSPDELNGCVNDAAEMRKVLEKNENGSSNFDVISLTSDEEPVNSNTLFDSLSELFSGDAETAVFYFAGHGIINEESDAGFLATQDGRKPNWGVSLSEILNMANSSYPRIKSSVIILDCCNSGFAGEVSGLGRSSKVSIIGNGVTILTACEREGAALETDGQGTFTSILLDGLYGSASDVMGRITPASLYAHIDQTLGAWEQRPIYKANVRNFITLRQATPKVPFAVLRRLPEYFPNPADVFKLDPSYEPDRGEEAERLQHIPVVSEHVEKFRELQKCNREGLVVPVEQPHMWHAAVFSSGCKLTATGAHYRKLAELNRIRG